MDGSRYEPLVGLRYMYIGCAWCLMYEITTVVGGSSNELSGYWILFNYSHVL